ncbi:MAG: PilZ domain-containing protein [Candidatus Omnitrophota bacterium]
MEERRRYMRFKTSLQVFYKVLNGLPTAIESSVVDVSREGLRLSDEKGMMKGSIVELSINIPGENEPVVAFAEEIWSRQSGEKKYDKGMRFTNISQDARSKLIGYAYDRLAKDYENIEL